MALVRVFFSNFPKISLCASVRAHYTEQPAVNFNVLQRGTQNNGINNGMTQFFLQINCKLCIIANDQHLCDSRGFSSIKDYILLPNQAQVTQVNLIGH